MPPPPAEEDDSRIDIERLESEAPTHDDGHDDSESEMPVITSASVRGDPTHQRRIDETDCEYPSTW